MVYRMFFDKVVKCMVEIEAETLTDAKVLFEDGDYQAEHESDCSVQLTRCEAVPSA